MPEALLTAPRGGSFITAKVTLLQKRFSQKPTQRRLDIAHLIANKSIGYLPDS